MDFPFCIVLLYFFAKCKQTKQSSWKTVHTCFSFPFNNSWSIYGLVCCWNSISAMLMGRGNVARGRDFTRSRKAFVLVMLGKCTSLELGLIKLPWFDKVLIADIIYKNFLKRRDSVSAAVMFPARGNYLGKQNIGIQGAGKLLTDKTSLCLWCVKPRSQGLHVPPNLNFPRKTNFNNVTTHADLFKSRIVVWIFSWKVIMHSEKEDWKQLKSEKEAISPYLGPPNCTQSRKENQIFHSPVEDEMGY